MRIIIWGTGRVEKSIDPYILESVEIVAFVDNNKNNWNTYVCRNENNEYQKIRIESPDILKKVHYDYIIIASTFFDEIEKQCIEEYGITADKIICAITLVKYNIDIISEIFDTNILSDTLNYKIGGSKILLGKKHPLPKYQRDFQMHDRFIPYLASITDKKDGEWIIDIGANIGDTVMAMVDYTSDKFICIEPTEQFLNLLAENIKMINDFNRVDVEQVFISDNENDNFISDIYTSGSAIKRKTDKKQMIQTKTLDTILKGKKISPNKIDLIKIDTDGFDSECILSAKETLCLGNALLYWENAIFEYNQYIKYKSAYALLEQAGYKTFFIFDNTGNFLCKGTIETLCSINDYLQRINENWSRVTFHYIDVLGCKDIDKDKCEYAVEKYLSRFLLRRRLMD